MNLQIWTSSHNKGRLPRGGLSYFRGLAECARSSPRVSLVILLFCLFITSGCAPVVQQTGLFTASSLPEDTPPEHFPTFLVENPQKDFNRIGTPVMRGKDAPKAEVDPDRSSIYFTRTNFSTGRGNYTNLVFRIHFQKVPFGWDQLNLTAGNNPGLLIIYTLSDTGELLLITTLHTCGCYLAFIPTSNLTDNAMPKDWPSHGQWVFGNRLPSRITTPPKGTSLQFTIADGTHRIKAVTMASNSPAQQNLRTMQLSPMTSLYFLPWQGQTASFFETGGARRGYVKNSSRPLEMLLISWWAFDLKVGEDKAYLGGDATDIPLYTSLKFWARESSDLKDFAGFLRYWGWGL